MPEYNSFHMQLLQEVQRGLREDLRFQPEPDTDTSEIVSEAIVIRKVLPSRSEFPANTNEITPGWLIAPGSKIPRPGSAGENQVDIALYPILLQLVDQDRDSLDRNLATYPWWQEQAARYFNHRFASYKINNGGRCTRDSLAREVQVVDRKVFLQHALFRGGVEILVEVGETRGAFQ